MPPALTKHNRPQYRFRGQISPQEAEQNGARAEAIAGSEGDTAVLRIYDVLDSWGGFWGLSAGEVVSALDDLGEEITKIQVHINSPGGEATEGVAIYNALVNHSAHIDVIIDGLAASAASLVAVAGDTVTMAPGTELMIHDPWMFCIGDADDMTKTANLLDHMGDNLASIYAERAGGTTASWREAMSEETWYNPQEAVDAGLATAVAKKRSRSNADSASDKFDLTVFNYAGREHAPAPKLANTARSNRANVRNSSTQGQENSRMTREQLEAIGLAENATDDQINARLAELVSNQSDTPSGDEPNPPSQTDPTGDPDPDDEPDPAGTGGDATPGGDVDPDDTEPGGSTPPPPAQPPETVVVDKVQWNSVLAQLNQLTQKDVKNEQEKTEGERDAYLQAALDKGKFQPAQLADYKAFWDSNAKAAKAAVDRLAPNTVPVLQLGYQGSDTVVADDSYPTSALSASEKEAIAKARQGA